MTQSTPHKSVSGRHPSRRDLSSHALGLGVVGATLGAASGFDAKAQVGAKKLNETVLTWLDQTPPNRSEGVTLGVPWPRGALKSSAKLTLSDGQGLIPTQVWPLAVWPDGSVKWTAIATPALDKPLRSYRLVADKTPDLGKDALKVTSTAQGVQIGLGTQIWELCQTGPCLIKSMSDNGLERLNNAQFVLITKSRSDDEETGASDTTRYVSRIEKLEVEQSGPVRAVVRFEGRMVDPNRDGGRSWLPFTVRLYFTAKSNRVRIVHSFIYDGDETRDFISGLGLEATVPMRDALYDRHIRYAGKDKGVWGEAVRSLTGLRRDAGKAFREAQIAGKAVPPLANMSPAVAKGLDYIPAWGDFTLSQTDSEGFTLRKRLESGRAPIGITEGEQARGLAYIGGATGGIALGIKDFWQAAPKRLDIRNAHTDKAKIIAWLWSPDAPAMDLRPYRGVMGMDTFAKQTEGLNITYEDYEPDLGRPFGIAKTHELSLFALSATPSNDVFSDMADEVSLSPRLIVSPARLKEAGVFGAWGLIDRNGSVKSAIEDRLDLTLNYYLLSIKTHKWYGFWNYGDVMHTYDADRHGWRYDIGGYAWDNSELSTDLWLWLSYVRSGRADVFRMAEAMTRHTGEVDVYHIGKFAGFGTRHGVQHFSDSSKQPRISNAAYRRFYYYLTADERCGDLMRALNDSDQTLDNIDISRKLPNNRFPGQLVCGFGTSWGSFLAAWLTEWERTGSPVYRDKILNGMKSIAGLKNGWFCGEAPYDPKTGKFLGTGDHLSFSHLNNLFGVFEVHAELMELLNPGPYAKTWLDYCQYTNAPQDQVDAFLGQKLRITRYVVHYSRFTAYAAIKRNDAALKARAWSEFLSEAISLSKGQVITAPTVLSDRLEDVAISTNDSAQFGVSAIGILGLLGDIAEEAGKPFLKLRTGDGLKP